MFPISAEMFPISAEIFPISAEIFPISTISKIRDSCYAKANQKKSSKILQTVFELQNFIEFQHFFSMLCVRADIQLNDVRNAVFVSTGVGNGT